MPSSPFEDSTPVSPGDRLNSILETELPNECRARIRVSLTGERAKSIGDGRHARQQEPIDVNTGWQVSEAFQRPNQRFEPSDRDTAGRIEKISLAIERVGLLDFVRFEAARLD